MRALHDDAGNVVADLDHDSYGNPQATVQSVAQPYRFTGREYDKDTGLYQYRAREYDPVTGRFLQEDPIWFDSGDMNVYRYTWNNPVMWRDPSGMSPAIEYGCLAQFALGAGTSAGSTSALGSSWLFTRVGQALAVAAGQIDRIELYQKLHDEAELKVTAVVVAAEIALRGARCGKVAKPKVCKRKGGPTRKSFAAGTPVATVAGRKPIEQVQVGDVVKAIDPATGLVAWKRVTERHERTATAGIVRVTMEDAFGQRETLTVTQNHPYLRAANDNGPGILNAVRLDPGGDWSAAGMLRPGDRVQSGKGAHLEVVAVEPVEGPAAKVYNFEVADHHTYAVGELEAWAHNAGSWPRTPEGAPSGWGRPTITPNGSGFGSKYQWTLSCGCKITFENHGQHRDAPLFHRGTHWHVECPGWKNRRRYLPGQRMSDRWSR